MIDPIRAFGTSLIDRNDSVQRSSPPLVKKETQDASVREPLADTKTKIDKDVVALSFNLNGDLKSIQQAVSTVNEQVRNQFERIFGLPSEEDGNTDGYLLGDNASQEEILDYIRPDNTAKRIVGFATSFFDAYLQAHQGKPEEQNADEFSKKVDDFANLITGAIQDGFDQAKQVLRNTEDLGEIGDNIQKTYDLVLEEIASFREKFISHFKDSSSEEIQLETSLVDNTQSTDDSSSESGETDSTSTDLTDE